MFYFYFIVLRIDFKILIYFCLLFELNFNSHFCFSLNYCRRQDIFNYLSQEQFRARFEGGGAALVIEPSPPEDLIGPIRAIPSICRVIDLICLLSRNTIDHACICFVFKQKKTQLCNIGTLRSRL